MDIELLVADKDVISPELYTFPNPEPIDCIESVVCIDNALGRYSNCASDDNFDMSLAANNGVIVLNIAIINKKRFT